MSRPWKYRSVLIVAIIGLGLICAGLVLAYLSDPSRYTINVRDDHRIVRLYLAGVLVTSIGLIAFVAAINQTSVNIAPKPRRDINLGIGGGITCQVCAFSEQDPAMIIGWLLTAMLLIVWACMRFAEAKGFSKWYGVLGVLGIFGLIILLLLPTRTAQPGNKDSDTSASNLSQRQGDESNDVASATRVESSQNPYEPSSGPADHPAISTSRLKPAITFGLVFLLGCAVVVLPMFAYAMAIQADETARGEPTMASGIQMFLGVVFAPLGGIVACFIFLFYRRRQSP
ncbi:hypothetical protein [Aporhodopirellula aestuarii]|uniref:Uncharacterized protein n=1 Tax=Aporhodopirellula aestuarii TaxID=2950107 RepID=A0ABT0U5V7_9BACT|nr:hypothetical protein [Aporhodopirellula aestuarii]MCM2372327.1 hypothetical protein [Aporhodopirellula aestuarii]